MKYGRYKIIKELGRGAMGIVYQAHDPRIDRMVALKVLRADRVVSEDFVRRFLKEAIAIGRLSHPNIVTVYDVGQDHETVYIAMEFLEGGSLDKVIQKTGMSMGDIIRFGIRMADALDYAHQKGIIHRDIKPTNIIFNPGGNFKITDFGIARIEDPSTSQMTQAGEILGTPMYMSPEQVMGNTVDGRSDIYSLGVMLYELAAGKRPYFGKSLPAIFRAITDVIPSPPETHNPEISAELSAVIQRAIAKNPENRFPDGKALKNGLERCIVKTEGMEDQKKNKTGKKRIHLLVVLAVLLIIGLALGRYVGDMDFLKPIPISLPDKSVHHSKSLEKKAVLDLETEPTGAEVFINGVLKGNTPLSLKILPGKYEVRLTKKKYYDWQAQVKLEDERTPVFVKLSKINN